MVFGKHPDLLNLNKGRYPVKIPGAAANKCLISARCLQQQLPSIKTRFRGIRTLRKEMDVILELDADLK